MIYRERIIREASIQVPVGPEPRDYLLMIDVGVDDEMGTFDMHARLLDTRDGFDAVHIGSRFRHLGIGSQLEEYDNVTSRNNLLFQKRREIPA